eukprot:Phypoly_transcript_05242.p1 GENE.Phypoly_transcript_05242~~Phypoly_transcript_05242.p1  ORF type:complete len:552 (+),score=102.74 Phypoly_transcript_05242:87-1742(+)
MDHAPPFTQDELSKLTRVEVQYVAKLNGVRANGKTVDIIAALLELKEAPEGAKQIAEIEKSNDENNNANKRKYDSDDEREYFEAPIKKVKREADDGSLTIADSWKMIEEYLKEHAPEQYDILMNKCQGVPEDKLNYTESGMGVKMPKYLKESLLIHDIKNEIPALALYGYKLPLAQMDKSRKHMIVNVSGPIEDMTVYIPLYLYNQDRTYFYMVVDVYTEAVMFFDFHDLVTPPTGRICAWSFRSYLSSLAKNLCAGKIKYNHFPSYSFGFTGTKKILSLMPCHRELKIKTKKTGKFDKAPKLREAINAAQKHPYDNWIELPQKEKKDTPLPPLPAELQTDDVAFTEISWNIPKESIPEGGSINDKILENGKVIQAGSKAYGEQVFMSGKHYFEIQTKKFASIFAVGLCSGNLRQRKTNFMTPELFGIGYSGRYITATSYAWGTRGANVSVFDDTKQIKKGDVIGILVDMEKKQAQFFHNRVAVAAPCSILDDEFRPQLTYSDSVESPPKTETMPDDPMQQPEFPVSVHGVRPYVYCFEAVLRILPLPSRA